MTRLSWVVASGVLLAGCFWGDNGGLPAGDDDPATDGGPPVEEDATIEPDGAPPFPFARCDGAPYPLPDLIENEAVYEPEAVPEVLTIELDIADMETFGLINTGMVDVEVPVVFHQGAMVAPQATIRIRGGMSRFNAQKNYKIELYDGARWRGQKEININKHMWDLTRTRNKLAFDLFETVPDITSLRTQFVQLYVNGQNYGMYTWIEEPDKRFLESHGLDPDGQLYKAAVFWFQDLDPAVLADPVMLQYHIEAKANPDTEKLARVLAAIADDEQDVDEIVDVYFNRDNLVTWLAINVLLNNIDTRTQNYYIYSPSSCEGWYLLPWDYDGAFGFYGQLEVDDRARWERGLSNWWLSSLFKRFLTDLDNVQAVHDKVLELSSTLITDEEIAERLAAYRELVVQHISTEPDIEYLPGPSTPPSVAIATWEAERTRISSTVSRFRAEYLDTLGRPMPMFINATITPTPPWVFRWNFSFDLQHDPLTYDMHISTSPDFAAGTIVHQQLGLTENDTLVPALPPGTYYWRTLARDATAPDHWQEPYDPYDVIVVP